MKRLSQLLVVVVLFLINGITHGQIFDPVQWTQSYKKLNGQEYELIFKARIDEGWTIYSQELVGDGPIPTSFF